MGERTEVAGRFRPHNPCYFKDIVDTRLPIPSPCDKGIEAVTLRGIIFASSVDTTHFVRAESERYIADTEGLFALGYAAWFVG